MIDQAQIVDELRTALGSDLKIAVELANQEFIRAQATLDCRPCVTVEDYKARYQPEFTDSINGAIKILQYARLKAAILIAMKCLESAGSES